MRSYGAMAGKYLRQQRKRTILTIVGIVLSAALISALGTMGQTLKDNSIRNVKYEEGAFHFAYSEPTSELYASLRKHVLVDQLGYYRHGESSPLEDSVAVTVEEADSEALQLLPIHLNKGRLPASPDELAVEQWILERLPGNPGLDGSAQLTDPNGNQRNYRIVGILNNKKNSQVNGNSSAFTLADSASRTIDERAMLLLTFKSGVDISAQIDDFTGLNSSLFTNNTLLAYLGESEDDSLNTALAVIFGILIGLVVLSTVAVIYNAFHIAVLERVRQFGLLRTLGATPAQIRSLVLREATVLSTIGVPAGLLIGGFGLWLALWLMMQAGLKILMMETFELTFHWWIFAGSLAIGYIAVYLAAWLPARKASGVSPVDAAKGAGGIVRETYRKLRIPSLLNLAGIEGRMASNNIRRNRTKFRITTFSIVISILLFIVFHYFTQQALTLTTTTNEDDRIAFRLTRTALPDKSGNVPAPGERIPDALMEEIAALPGVEAVYGVYDRMSLFSLVPEPKLGGGIRTITETDYEKTNVGGEENSRIPTRVLVYDEARLKQASKYLRSGTTDPARLAEGDNVLLLQTIKPFTNNGKKAIMDLTRYRVGDRIAVWANAGSAEEDPDIREVTVAGILTESPFDASYSSSMLTIIGTRSTFAELLEGAAGEYPPSDYDAERRGLEVALRDGADAEPIRAKLREIARSHPGSQLIDYAEAQKQTRNFNLQMRIFVYGFLAVIGVIGSLNIINTVQTNLLLRRREIGLLQAVGMTMGQIRKMATAEGVWFGVIGSFWGILLGAGLCYLLYGQLSGSVQDFPFEFPWRASLIACGAALLVGVISVQGPLRRMEKANLLEELREEA
ncbi:ABC transporter permease [Cohnella cellulosilytica]|uniref:ABC transporter permease n=1 Tax=Cohnella cellulosilytica TaxID=986710 RepID=A0ABW2FMV0_9BACL